MFDIKSYQKADSVQAALKLLQADPQARLIAGGTDVLIKLHKGQEQFGHLVDIHGIAELDFITRAADGSLLIGPGCCFTRVAESALVRRHIPVLAVAVESIGGPQVRNMATIGGNICNGVPSADSACPLMALNAVLTIEGASGPRQMPIGDFFLGPGRVALAQDEILTAITVTRADYDGYHGHFYKYAMRDAMDIATINCAAVCKVAGGTLEDLRLAYGTAAPVPIRCRRAETKATGRRLSPELLDEIAGWVADDVQPRTSWRASRDFRLQIITTLARRVVKQAILNAEGSIA